MSSPIAWGLGLAGSGIDLATLYPDYFAVPVIWLNSASGSDANAGAEPELPLATTAQAVTNASAGAVIAVAATHNEVISSTVTIAKAGLHFVGFGTGTSRATYTAASGATPCFTVAAGGSDTCFDSLYFKAAAATPGAGGRITTAVTGTELRSCQFDCGVNDQEAVLFTSGADNVRVEACAFTAVGSRPTRAMAFTGAPNTNVKIVSTTIDGATFGWAGSALTVSGVVRLQVRGLTLAGNADMAGTAVPTYQIFGVTTSGAGKVALT